MLITEIGIIVRALPIEDGLSIKMLIKDGGVSLLHIPAARPEFIAFARQARVDETEVLVRRTSEGDVVALQSAEIANAA